MVCIRASDLITQAQFTVYLEFCQIGPQNCRGVLRAYRMEFSEKSGLSPCPVERFSDKAETQTAMQVHFWHRNVRDTVAILEEGNLHRPRYPLCNMPVPWRSLNGSHKPIDPMDRVVSTIEWFVSGPQI